MRTIYTTTKYFVTRELYFRKAHKKEREKRNDSKNPLTFDPIHGNIIPIVKIPNNGPFVIASKLIVNWSTVLPIFSTKNTRQRQNTPTPTTTNRIIQLIVCSVSGCLTKGLTKSSSTTADMELRHVERELSAALKTPATNNPVSPGNSCNVCITNNGKSWSFRRAS